MTNTISYSEKAWQHEILDILLLLYPKYIKVFEEVSIRDVYAKKNRRLDYLLVDSKGFVDIIEIKKPQDVLLVSNNLYRDSHVPLKELSGTIMQIEKYIYYLNKWGIPGEEQLTNRYKDLLPNGLLLKIVNPSGMIILGRSKGLSDTQLQDLEVIKRKYKNIVEIMTYDDLVERVANLIFKYTGKLPY